MGACLSCCGDGSSGSGGDSGERRHLLADPVGGSSNNINRVQSDDYSSRSSKDGPRKDEQSALSRILNQTSINVIDVTTLASHDLEQHEYYERMKAYNARLNGLVRWSPPSRPGLLLVDIPSHEVCLAAEPITAETLYLISNAVEKLTEAVSAIKVVHKEDLVVPFRIP